MKNSHDPSKMKRDTIMGFGCTWLVYTLIGGFGAIAISTIDRRPGTIGDVVLDFM